MAKVGIVGGMGPEAGIDIARKLAEAEEEREERLRVPFLLHSMPSLIPDRNSFLNGTFEDNPGYAIANAVEDLADIGVEVCGIACNAAHAPAIFDIVRDAAYRRRVTLVSVVDATMESMNGKGLSRRVTPIGVSGTRRARVYENAFAAAGMELIELDEKCAQLAHDIVWDRDFGVKFSKHGVKKRTIEVFISLCEALFDAGTETVVLACTELPLVWQTISPERLPRGMYFLDANLAFVESLLRHAKSIDRNRVDSDRSGKSSHRSL